MLDQTERLTTFCGFPIMDMPREDRTLALEVAKSPEKTSPEIEALFAKYMFVGNLAEVTQ